MSRVSLALAALTVTLGAAGFWLLKSYSPELVHAIVLNALIQKAPAEIAPERIRTTFEAAFERCKRQHRRRQYMEHLLRLSQRLEKIQRISHSEVEEILVDISSFAAQGVGKQPVFHVNMRACIAPAAGRC